MNNDTIGVACIVNRKMKFIPILRTYERGSRGLVPVAMNLVNIILKDNSVAIRFLLS